MTVFTESQAMRAHQLCADFAGMTQAFLLQKKEFGFTDETVARMQRLIDEYEKLLLAL